jgi:hypothetical protein
MNYTKISIIKCKENQRFFPNSPAFMSPVKKQANPKIKTICDFQQTLHKSEKQSVLLIRLFRDFFVLMFP